VQKAHVVGGGQVAQLVVGMHHRPLVGRHHVDAGLQRCADVVDGRLAGVRVHRGVLKQHLRLAGSQPIAQLAQGLVGRAPRFAQRLPAVAGNGRALANQVSAANPAGLACQPRRRVATPVKVNVTP